MEQSITNMQKYANYKEQMERLKKALANGFYLEAVFIEYAILEDRTESVLRHSGKWNPKPKQRISIDQKCKTIARMAEEKKTLANKYFSPELTDGMLAWKTRRNDLIHELLKHTHQAEDFKSIALEGQLLAKTMCSKTTQYNRALERAAEKEK